jgi:catechol-2,3-dioxygenase
MIDTDRQKQLATERGILKPQKLAHVVRRTSRFDELVQWYCTVLGAEVVHTDGILAFLTYDDEHHRIAIAAIPGLDEQPAMAAGTRRHCVELA